MSTSKFKVTQKQQVVPYTLTCGFHTLEIRIDGHYDAHPIFEDPEITKTSYKVGRDGMPRTYIILNLNKLFELGIPEINEILGTDLDSPPHRAYIEKFSIFQKAFLFVLDSLGITDYKIIRADLKFDNSDPNFFQYYEKLHRYILLGFKAASGALNAYKTTELDCPKNISASVRDNTWQIESYDKNRESNGRDPSAARLEIRSVGRSKGMDRGNGELDGLRQEFLSTWHTRFENAIDKLSDTKQLTAKLIEWYETKTLNGDLSATLRLCEDYVYDPKQIEVISDALYPDKPLKNPSNFASVWKKRYNVRLYNLRDVKRSIQEIYRSMDEFFNG